MTDNHHKKLAESLYNSYNNGQSISRKESDITIDAASAYQIQHYVLNKKVEKKDHHTGYKISLTSKETQDLFKSTTPLYGAFTKSSISDGTIELGGMLSPLIELELVFTVKEDLSIDDSLQMILDKTTVSPGIEVPDSRFNDWFPKLKLGLVIADSAVAGKVVIGTPVDGLTFEQLNNIQATLKLNGEILDIGYSSEVLDNPVYAVKWLINELSGNGLILKKGMIISSGTFIMPKVLECGKYEAVFEGIGEVSLNVL